jgi:putative ABC transport system ATP-binding protein
MIELKSVSKTFYAGTLQQVDALKVTDLILPAESFTMIIGSNGSGKSTLLNAIAGTINTQGTILIDGQNVSTWPSYKRSRKISRIFQNPLSGTASDLTVIENFRLAALRTQSKFLKIGITTSFEKMVTDKIASLNLGLENKLNQKMGNLSGGQRQILTLVMAVMAPSSVLLMDEPTAALDPRAAQVLMRSAAQLIAEHKLTVLMVTHNMKDAQQYGNRLIQMHDGSIVKHLLSEAKANLQTTTIYQWFE